MPWFRYTYRVGAMANDSRATLVRIDRHTGERRQAEVTYDFAASRWRWREIDARGHVPWRANRILKKARGRLLEEEDRQKADAVWKPCLKEDE